MSTGWVGDPFSKRTSLIDISANNRLGSMIDMEQYNYYAITLPVMTGVGAMGFWGADKADDTFVEIKDESGAAVTIGTTASSTTYSLDVATMRYLLPFRFIKPKAGDIQAADRTLTFRLRRD